MSKHSMRTISNILKKESMKATENKYEVNQKLWKSFGIIGKEVFNSTMDASLSNQGNMLHPKQDPIKPEHWRTICWNISCQSAWAANKAL